MRQAEQHTLICNIRSAFISVRESNFLYHRKIPIFMVGKFDTENEFKSIGIPNMFVSYWVA